jgi:hypothetical protein
MLSRPRRVFDDAEMDVEGFLSTACFAQIGMLKISEENIQR